jgi:hypothetical protein
VERTPRSSLLGLTPQLHQLQTTEAPTVTFAEANVLFIVNGGTPQHKGFKGTVHQLLLRARGASEATKMVFFNETFNQYVVQDVTTANGRINAEVVDTFSSFGQSRLLQLQRGTDLVVIFTTRSTIGSSAHRQLLGMERIRTARLQDTPHILILGNEGANKPTPLEAFLAVRHLADLPNVAILYQAAPSRVSLGYCHILHIEGCLRNLHNRGRLDGRSFIDDQVDWHDLPELDLSTSLEQAALPRNQAPPAQLTVLRNRAPSIPRPAAEPLRRRVVRAVTNPPPSEPSPVLEETEDRTLRRIRRISQLITSSTRDPDTLSALQRELRNEHRRNSRALPINYERPPSSLRPPSMYLEPHPAPTTPNSFRGECPICCEEDTQLVFLLKQSSPFVPADGSLHWPFALGSDPANDIVSAFLCCDNCSYYFVEDGRTPLREACTGAFSLIPYSPNAGRWKDDLSRGLSHYDASARDLLPLVFLAIVDHTLQNKTWAQPDGSMENEIRRNALLWAMAEITGNMHMTGNGHSDFLGAWIAKIVTEPKRGWGSMVWSYPMAGFVFMLRLAREAKPQQQQQHHLGKVLHQRLLMEILRRFRAPGTELRSASVLKLNEMLLDRTVEDDEWLAYLAAEGALEDEAWEAVQKLQEEMEWVGKNSRWAMVLWLGWMPQAQEMEGNTAMVVERLAEEGAAGVVVAWPEEIDRAWCEGAAMGRAK